MKKKYLFVVAHPDDELLGAGATMYDLIKKGNEVSVCVLTHECNTRVDDLCEVMISTHKLLGVKETFVGSFRCLQLEQENHHDIVKFVEEAITKTEPDVVFTHHQNDMNIDHNVTSEICIEAIRLPQRMIGYNKKITDLLMMEVPSETDFGGNPAMNKFSPNTYNEVSEGAIEAKIKLLDMYDSVLRQAPHPRNERTLKALAVVRGSESGFMYAEAFQSMFKLGV